MKKLFLHQELIVLELLVFITVNANSLLLGPPSGILDSCIMWEKSAENAKCKVCRKKGDESKVLLCDGCNEVRTATPEVVILPNDVMNGIVLYCLVLLSNFTP